MTGQRNYDEITSVFGLFLTKLPKKSLYQIGHIPCIQCYQMYGVDH